jgi:signal transduction histidine kinase
MKLASKFILALVLGICVVVTVNAYIRAQSEFAHLEAGLKADHHDLGLTLAIAVKDLWSFAGEKRVLDFVEEINRGRPEIGIRWVWPDAPAGSPNAPIVPREKLAPLSSGEMVDWMDRDASYFYSYAPVKVDGTRTGAIELTESLARERQHEREVIQNRLIGTVGTLSVFLFLVAALGFWFVGRPIQALIQKARRVGAGDLTGPLELHQRDELSELARELNSMCLRLTEAREKLAAETSARIATIEQLRHAERLKTVGTLASGIAHELGNPLNVALARTNMISSGSAQGEAAVANSRLIGDQLDRMTKIIRQLLDFARPHSPKRARINLSQVTRQTLDLLGPIAKKRGAHLHLSDGEMHILADIDPDQFQQVITNLVVNGIQSMKDGGNVNVQIQWVQTKPPHDHGGPEGEYIRLSVRDEGEGIPPENLPRLFEPFFTTKRVGEGTGLGLSVSYGIVREHGGWIAAESRVGAGSCFSVYIPSGR